MSAEHMPDAERLRGLLVGRTVVSASVSDERPPDTYYAGGPTGTLTLDNGTVLKVWGNDGGCACSAGCYPLETLNDCDSVITNVEVEEAPDDESACDECGRYYCDHGPEDGYYRIFVIAAEDRRLLASFEGSDGNGYYGTGWWLAVEAEAAS